MVQAVRQSSGSAMEPSMKRNRASAPSPAPERARTRLRRYPALRSSRPTTSCPAESSASARCEPMNPAAPVTSQRRRFPSFGPNASSRAE